MTENFKEKVRAFSHIGILITFVVALLIAAKVVVIPLAISFLFAIVLNPFLRRLENIRMPRVLAIVVVLLTFVVVIGGIFTYCGYQLTSLLNDLPGLQERVLNLVNDMRVQLAERFNISAPQQNRWMTNLADSVGPFFTGFLQTTGSILTVVAQIPIYIFLMLLYKDRFRVFLNTISRRPDDAPSAQINEVKEVVQGYVLGMFIVICILAVLNSIGLLLLGIKYALFFGILSAILTIIPYIGNFIGGFFPFLVALVTKDSAWYAVGVIAVYAFIQFLEGNFITPNVMGSRVSINPLIALLSMIIGGQMLGVAGLIIAIPFVGILKLLFSHSKTLWPLVILMEDRPTKNGESP